MLLEDMPKACHKKHLKAAFRVVPEKLLVGTLNKIMAKNRGIPLEKVKYCRFVQLKEVEQLMVELGYLPKDENIPPILTI